MLAEAAKLTGEPAQTAIGLAGEIVTEGGDVRTVKGADPVQFPILPLVTSAQPDIGGNAVFDD
ncbi:hypothetical protein GCM10028806_03880 [Spirosoma terrae]